MAVPVPTIVPRWAQLIAWQASTYYAVGERAINSGNLYQVTAAGTSAGSGGPTGTGGAITDGGVTWAYQGASATAWTGSHAYALGDRVTNGGNLYQCTTAGTSASSGGPTGTADPITGVNDITDGGAHWMYLSSATALVVVPSLAQMDSGWIVGQKPPAQYFNWWMNRVYLWLRWLADLANQAFTWTAAHIFQKGLTATQSTTNGTAIAGTGNGAGSGVNGTGGISNGAGGDFTGGATNGNGVQGHGTGSGVGGLFNGAGTGAGVQGSGGTNAPGVIGAGAGTGNGGQFSAAATGNGVTGTGGTGGGSGGVFNGGNTNGAGVVATGKGTANGVTGTGGPTSGYGGFFTAGGGNADGVDGQGAGTGAGVTGTGGTAGPGVVGIGGGGLGIGGDFAGAASGRGVRGLGGATSGAGGEFTAQGANSYGVVGTGHNQGLGGSFNAGATSNVALEGQQGDVQAIGKVTAGAQVNGDLRGRRVQCNGTPLVAGDFSLGAGWGSTASVSAIRGSDGTFEVQITAGGSGIAANPTTQVSWKDADWTNVPMVTVQLRNSSDATSISKFLSWSPTIATNIWTFFHTPVTGNTYIFVCRAEGID